MIRLQALLLVLLFALFAGVAQGEELPISAGDRLTIEVTGESMLSTGYTVDRDGNIFIPILGKVPVKGMFPAQVRDELTRRLAKFIRDPQVNVEFLERAQIAVSITGSVGKPGQVTLKQGSRLLDALAQVEGLAPEADDKSVRLQRRGEQVQLLDLSKLGKDVAVNVELRDGDAIIVPKIPMNSIRVLGAVARPGELLRKDRVTLQDAIQSAGGPTEDADLKAKVQVLRRGATEPELIPYADVQTGKVNRLLEDGDVVTLAASEKVLIKVFGAVGKPTAEPMRAGTTVLEAISVAGGFAVDADKSAIMLTLPTGETRRANLLKVDHPDNMMVLPDGATVSVPQQVLARYYVSGGVNEPGTFAMPQDPAEKVYLTEALGQAKGLAERAKKKTLVVVRHPKGGMPQPISIDLDAILKRKDPAKNIEIMANDVIYVDVEPERDRGRGGSILERALGVASLFVGF